MHKRVARVSDPLECLRDRHGTFPVDPDPKVMQMHVNEWCPVLKDRFIFKRRRSISAKTQPMRIEATIRRSFKRVYVPRRENIK